MKMSMGLRQIQLCSICEEDIQNHAESCELGRLEKLVRLQVSHNCPLCHKRSVSLNRDDFYECCECHTQFSRTPLYGEPVHCGVRLHILTEDEALPVHVLAEKGKSNFKFDREIAEAQAALHKVRVHLGLELEDEDPS